jgi:hypothetical protein
MSRSRTSLERAIAWTPILALLFLITFTVTAYFRVGHWPQYGKPDPKELGLPFFHAAALLSYPVAIVASIAGLIWLGTAAVPWKKSRAAVFLLGISLWALSIPKAGSLLSWLLD